MKFIILTSLNILILINFLISSENHLPQKTPKEKIKYYLKADKVEYIYKKDSNLDCIWSGNVKLEGENIIVFADEMKEYKDKEKIEACGNIKIIWKEKNTEKKEEEIILTGGYLEYIKKEDYFKISKNPVLKTSQAILTCEYIERFDKEKITNAYNNVKILYKDIEALGDIGIYYEEEKKITLTGKSFSKIIKKDEFIAQGKIVYFFVESEELIIEKEVVAEFEIKEEKERK